jgi:hypothetical protein
MRPGLTLETLDDELAMSGRSLVLATAGHDFGKERRKDTRWAHFLSPAICFSLRSRTPA